ncbi:hypothetical protein P691DRAFT_720158 [Macrolepiota fuliginosa MF-IS2]|uniref:Nucleolar protein 16 n=1 Tax=Macrolepiota fuliginosa MF-IS2 TaxID=1400762 RepID=A0A9P5XM54_9AGAR|nr:hypothetical protein P691DRAFT_720158 [Macrolepiota fuliginosa MF-IS2]
MANPRQRRKARSSSHRPVSHSKNAKRNLKKVPPIRGPKALQEAWDKRKTVQQNYAALGLLHSLNPLASGGTEVRQKLSSELDIQQTEAKINELSTTKPTEIPQGFGRIIRDEAGNVLKIEMNETAVDGTDADLSMEYSEPSVAAEALSVWTMGRAGAQYARNETKETIVEALEQTSTPQTASHALSFAISGTGPRRASTGEVVYLRKLVNRYGDDVEKMAKDRKLNPEQRTIGQLQRALRRAGFSVGGSG